MRRTAQYCVTLAISTHCALATLSIGWQQDGVRRPDVVQHKTDNQRSMGKPNAQPKGEQGTLQNEKANGPRAIDENEVKALISQLASKSFEVRERAQSSLLAMGKPLLKVLSQLEPSPSIEVRYRLRQITRELNSRRFIDYLWTLKCTPMDGESLNLKGVKTVRFFESGTFQQLDSGNQRRHTWHLTGDGKGIELNYNKGYAIYRGQFSDLKNAKGIAENVKGKKWYFQLTRHQNRFK